MNSQPKLRVAWTSGFDAFYELQVWREEAGKWSSATPTQIPLSDVRQWDTSVQSSAYRHVSGRFFSVVGVKHGVENEVSRTSNAMIDQPEVGLLGLAVTPSRTGFAALVQAKAEPGTVGGCQISPTVQATQSNQIQAHGGKPVLFLDLFQGPKMVLSDTIQSEHGSVFWQKRNRSLIIEVPFFEPPLGFRWVEIVDLVKLLAVDNLIHSDLRTVLALGPFWKNLNAPALVSEADRIRKWLSQHRSKSVVSATRVPINDLFGWTRQHDKLERIDGSGHEVIGVRVDALGREVDFWDQLMVKPRTVGLVALAVREHDGRLQALVRVCVEAGIENFIEIGPTVQVSDPNRISDKMQEGLVHVLNLDSCNTTGVQHRYDSLQSDEGGRFFRSEVRHVIVDCSISPPSGDYRWCDVKTLISIARPGNILNIQARDALACLLSTTF